MAEVEGPPGSVETQQATETTQVKEDTKYIPRNGATCSKVFVGGLNWDSTPELVKKYFNDWGVVLDVMLPRDRDSGRSRGFGFVTFSSIESADKVLGGTHSLDGRTLNISPAVAEKADEDSLPTKRLFVGDLLSTTTGEELKQTFEVFGKLEDAIIMKNPETMESRGFGFVTFESVQAAEEALKQTEHQVGRSIAKITRAQPKAGKGKGKGKGKGYDDGWGGKGGFGKGGKGYYDDGWGGKGGFGKGGKGYYDNGWGGKGGFGKGGGYGKGYEGYEGAAMGKGGYMGGAGGYSPAGYDYGGRGAGPAGYSPQPQQPMPVAYTQPEPEALPEGWQAARDDQGRQYFFHHPTKTSQWEMPKGIPPMPPPPAVAGYGGEYERSDQRYAHRPRPY